MLRRSMFVSAAWCASALGQASLRPDQVLVVYDSRTPESRLVAEHYAGSSKVPGGLGNVPGAHPTVRVLDLASTGAGGTLPGEFLYSQFAQRIRDPIKTWLNTNDPRGTVRCLVLTKGLPHRIQDTDNPAFGDQPVNADTELQGGDATYCTVDSELTILQRALDTGENGNPGDSFADGLIANPYHNATLPINAYSTRNRKVNRSWNNASVTGFNLGTLYVSRTTPVNQIFTPGDLYLVCRIDAPTVADCYAIIDRAQNPLVNMDTSAIILDESRSNGTPDANANTELDNDDLNDGTTSFLRLGDDYERTRDALAADGRFLNANVRYNKDAAPGGFVVGPLVNFGGGIVEPAPVLILASEASNTDGTPPGTAGRDLPTSFNWSGMGLYTSVESFNARAFGGLSSFIGQSQISEALAAGATFGIGNAYEPFAFAIPDTEVLTKRFYLGRLSFAESAWASVPALSWQQMILGDPLARVMRSVEDVNGDGRVDAEDQYEWERRFALGTAPNINRQGGTDDTDRQFIDQSPRPIDHVDMAGSQRP